MVLCEPMLLCSIVAVRSEKLPVAISNTMGRDVPHLIFHAPRVPDCQSPIEAAVGGRSRRGTGSEDSRSLFRDFSFGARARNVFSLSFNHVNWRLRNSLNQEVLRCPFKRPGGRDAVNQSVFAVLGVVRRCPPILFPPSAPLAPPSFSLRGCEPPKPSPCYPRTCVSSPWGRSPFCEVRGCRASPPTPSPHSSTPRYLGAPAMCFPATTMAHVHACRKG